MINLPPRRAAYRLTERGRDAAALLLVSIMLIALLIIGGVTPESIRALM